MDAHVLSTPLARGPVGYRVAGWLVVALEAVLAGAAAASGSPRAALSLVAGSAASALLLRLGRALPVLALLLALAAIGLNAVGWAWGLFIRPGPFDEVAHGLTGAALTPVLGLAVFGRLLEKEGPSWPLLVGCFALTLSAGALWEIAEWLLRVWSGEASLTRSLADAVLDLVLDAAGALAALPLVAWMARPSAQRPG